MRVTGLPAPPVRWITGLRLRPGVRRAGPRQGQRPALTPAPPRSSAGRFGNAVPAPTHADKYLRRLYLGVVAVNQEPSQSGMDVSRSGGNWQLF